MSSLVPPSSISALQLAQSVALRSTENLFTLLKSLPDESEVNNTFHLYGFNVFQTSSSPLPTNDHKLSLARNGSVHFTLHGLFGVFLPVSLTLLPPIQSPTASYYYHKVSLPVILYYHLHERSSVLLVSSHFNSAKFTILISYKEDTSRTSISGLYFCHGYSN